MSKANNRETNVQFVKRIMENSPYGALSQAFIIEAIGRYAKQCAAAHPTTMETSFMSGIAWKNVAEYVSNELSAKYDTGF
jgi:hypothetical protein